MSEIRTRPVGERFDCGGVMLEVVKVKDCFCTGCHWQNSGKVCDMLGYVAIGGACAPEVRSDRGNVIFKQVNE